MIAIVDYGVGNLFSLSSSVRSLGAEVRVTHEAADLHAASHILLPGVGAFGDAISVCMWKSGSFSCQPQSHNSGT